MIEIIGTELYQWDTGRSVRVESAGATHVHLANQGDSQAPIIELKDGQAKIPDYLLQTGKQLCAYAVANGVTIARKTFSVKKRERPENYVYDEDQRNFIYELITDAQKAIDTANQTAQDILDAKNRGEFNGPQGESGPAEVFIAEYGVTSFADMEEAYNAGKLLFCKEGRYTTPLYQVTSDGSYAFYRINATECMNIYRSTTKWGKNTSKLCGNEINNIKLEIGDIETALDGIIAIQNLLIGGDEV